MTCYRGQYAHTLVLPESDSYHKWELRWLNKPDTIPRYMRAAKWDLQDAKKRIEATIHWRRDFKPDLIPPEEVRLLVRRLARLLLTPEFRLGLRARPEKCAFPPLVPAWLEGLSGDIQCDKWL